MQELFFCADAKVKSMRRTISTRAGRFVILLCAASVFFVSLWWLFLAVTLTTETQRTQRLHREARTLKQYSSTSRSILITSLRHVSDDCHHQDVEKREHANDIEDHCAPAILRSAVHERHDKQEQSNQVEGHNAEHFTIHPENLCRQVLQGLEHEQEIPLRLDTRRRRCKGIGFFAQFPRKECGQRRQHPDSQNPANQIAQQEVWNELHLPYVLVLE